MVVFVRGHGFLILNLQSQKIQKGLFPGQVVPLKGYPPPLRFPWLEVRSSLGGPVELCQGEWVRNPRRQCGEFQFGKCMHGSSQEGRWTSDGDLFSWWWSVTWFSTWWCFFVPRKFEEWKLKNETCLKGDAFPKLSFWVSMLNFGAVNVPSLFYWKITSVLVVCQTIADIWILVRDS